MRSSEKGMRKKITIALVLALLTSAPACGYRLSGTGLLVPEGTKTIAVPGFINLTNEPYVDVEVTKAVTDEFIADGRLRVVDVEAAELVLRGKVARYDVTALSYTASNYVQQYRVRLVVDVSLQDLRSKKILWSEAGIEAVFIADYKVTIGDITSTKTAKEASIKKTSQDIAWTLRSRVLEGF
jgi:outer membrane lipopolysaccharide assembly protein LptE/RlpB